MTVSCDRMNMIKRHVALIKPHCYQRKERKYLNINEWNSTIAIQPESHSVLLVMVYAFNSDSGYMACVYVELLPL